MRCNLGIEQRVRALILAGDRSDKPSYEGATVSTGGVFWPTFCRTSLHIAVAAAAGNSTMATGMAILEHHYYSNLERVGEFLAVSGVLLTAFLAARFARAAWSTTGALLLALFPAWFAMVMTAMLLRHFTFFCYGCPSIVPGIMGRTGRRWICFLFGRLELAPPTAIMAVAVWTYTFKWCCAHADRSRIRTAMRVGMVLLSVALPYARVLYICLSRTSASPWLWFGDYVRTYILWVSGMAPFHLTLAILTTMLVCTTVAK